MNPKPLCVEPVGRKQRMNEEFASAFNLLQQNQVSLESNHIKCDSWELKWARRIWNQVPAPSVMTIQIS